MNITNIPQKQVLDKSGNLTSAWRVFFNQIVNQLQEFLSIERYKLPSKSTSDVINLGTSDNKGSILYDNEEEFVKINCNSEYKPVSSYEELTSSEVSSIPLGKRNGRIIYETDTGNTVLGSNDVFIVL